MFHGNNSVVESHKLICARENTGNRFKSYAAADIKSRFPAVKLKCSLGVRLYNVFVCKCYILPGREHH
jgi:hypothetical protein